MKARHTLHPAPSVAQSLSMTVAGFFSGRSGGGSSDARDVPARRTQPAADADADASSNAQSLATHAALMRHWKAIEADGISAAQFIEFLQPLADLEGLQVSPGTESSFFALK